MSGAILSEEIWERLRSKQYAERDDFPLRDDAAAWSELQATRELSPPQLNRVKRWVFEEGGFSLSLVANVRLLLLSLLLPFVLVLCHVFAVCLFSHVSALHSIA